MDFVAIDATKFSKYGGADSLKEEDQYKMKNVIRDLNKALIGFNFPEEFRHKVISTGKWGCGAFGGDPQVKFLIQWMAASLLRRPMIFHTFQDNFKLENLTEITTKYLNGKTIGNVYSYLKRFSRGTSEFSVFDSIVKMIEEDKEEAEISKRRQRLMEEDSDMHEDHN